jgi:hypothetical protein
MQRNRTKKQQLHAEQDFETEPTGLSSSLAVATAMQQHKGTRETKTIAVMNTPLLSGTSWLYCG